MSASFLRTALLFFLLPFSVQAEVNDTPPTVLVSIAPYRYFVERLAGDAVAVEVLVPPGASSHSYEPRPKQVVTISKAALWLRIGESAEKKTLDALQSHASEMRIVDLREGLDLISIPHHHHGHQCCCGDGHDPHIWLSARMAQPQAQRIAEELIHLLPERAATITDNLNSLLEDLKALDLELTALFADRAPVTILTAHPAYGYLCRDYGIRQLGIEYEGRDPTPRQLTSVIDEARSLGIRRVFVQQQHNRKGAEVVANAIGAEVIDLDPFSEDYLNNLRSIVTAFAGQ